MIEEKQPPQTSDHLHFFHCAPSRPLMETNSFAWIPTHQKTALSTLLESGQTSVFLPSFQIEVLLMIYVLILAQCGSLKI